MQTSKIKKLRLERGLTLADVAGQVGLSEGHMSRVEAGTRGLRFAKLDRLARVLGVPVAELAGGIEMRCTSDVAPYYPPKGSVIEKALSSSTQRMYRVLTNVLNEIKIVANDLIVVETNPKSFNKIENGKALIISILDEKGNEVLLLRQYIAPYLLITNSNDENELSLHMQKLEIKLIGSVID